ncbi:hypothetical protein [Xanthomonas sp. CFBP 8445]|uniref:hypothetical protein n=1 Tax=Xanthomonas sp. CFBP 8445 TaxID=2971236 RepID=UPI000314990A|nr:hypothetical protein [Xanthomonas sp. CFBP 8445]UYC12095.1 hypothetical protein NUG21_20545 [Xanthomonas sp. CFBP 8445]
MGAGTQRANADSAEATFATATDVHDKRAQDRSDNIDRRRTIAAAAFRTDARQHVPL